MTPTESLALPEFYGDMLTHNDKTMDAMADIQVNTTEPHRKFMRKEHTINAQLL